MPPTLTKAQALEIFVRLAAQFHATPAEHVTIKHAYDVLAALVEPAAPDAKTAP